MAFDKVWKILIFATAALAINLESSPWYETPTKFLGPLPRFHFSCGCNNKADDAWVTKQLCNLVKERLPDYADTGLVHPEWCAVWLREGYNGKGAHYFMSSESCKEIDSHCAAFYWEKLQTVTDVELFQNILQLGQNSEESSSSSEEESNHSESENGLDLDVIETLEDNGSTLTLEWERED